MSSNATIRGKIDGGYVLTAHCPNNHHSVLDLQVLGERFGFDVPVMRDDLLPVGEKANSITVSTKQDKQIIEGAYYSRNA